MRSTKRKSIICSKARCNCLTSAIQTKASERTNPSMKSSTLRLLNLLEVTLFAVFVGWYIWQLQGFYFYSWLVFPIWLIVSFVVHGDTPKTMGWRADNLFSAVRTSALVLGI